MNLLIFLNIFLSITLYSFSTFATASNSPATTEIKIKTYTLDTVWENIKSPIRNKTSKKTLYYGSALTLALLATRESTIDSVQERWSKENILGEDLSHFGDQMGKMIPNLTYSLGMYLNYKYTRSETSASRSLYMIEASLYSGLFTTILKPIVGEKRPNGNGNLSFPSGHTTTAFAFAAAIGMEHDWKYYVPAYTLATVVGLSRINDNKHYLHDVVAGATIGISYAIALHTQSKVHNETSVLVYLKPTPKNDGVLSQLTLLY